MSERYRPQEPTINQEARIGGFSHEKYTQPNEIGFSVHGIREGRAQQVLGGKVYLVIGAGYDGIGGATAREIAAWGGSVITSSPGATEEKREQAHELVHELQNLGSSDSLWVQGDITIAEDRKRVMQEALSANSRLDGLVIAAAKIDDTFFLRTNEQTERADWEINYWGPRYMIQLAVEQMVRRQKSEGGNVLAFSSLSAIASPFQYEYGPAKAALDNLIQSVSMDPQVKRAGNIKLNAISPGFVEGTSMVSHLKEGEKDALLELTDADRPLKPQEVAELSAFTLSEMCQVNGKLIPIIGVGKTMPYIDENRLIPR